MSQMSITSANVAFSCSCNEVLLIIFYLLITEMRSELLKQVLIRQINKSWIYNVMSLSVFLRLGSIPLWSYKLALVWPCLEITSLERNANHIRPTPTQLPPKLHVLPTPLCCRGHMIFPPAPDMICGWGLEADGASLLLCCFRRRVQRLQRFSGSRKGSSRGAVLLVTSWPGCITEGEKKSICL